MYRNTKRCYHHDRWHPQPQQRPLTASFRFWSRVCILLKVVEVFSNFFNHSVGSDAKNSNKGGFLYGTDKELAKKVKTGFGLTSKSKLELVCTL